MIAILATLLVLCMVSVSGAATYYFSSSGNNSRPCTDIDLPCQTTAHAESLNLVPGDQLLFKRGDTFTGANNFVATWSGTAAQPIVMGAYGTGARPVFDGGTTGQDTVYGIRIDGLHHLTVKDIRFTRFLKGVFILNSNNILIDNNEIDHIWGECLHIQTNSVASSIINNLIHHCGVGQNGEGIYVGTDPLHSPDVADQTRDILVQNNEIHSAVEGVECKPGTRNVSILNNYIHDNNLASFGAAIILNNFHSTLVINSNHLARGNIIRNITGAFGTGIYCRAGCRIHQNIIDHVSQAAIHVHVVSGTPYPVEVFHNTMVSNGGAAIQTTNNPDLTSINNLGWGNASGNVSTNPRFASETNRDYRLCTAANVPVAGCPGPSNAIDAGVPVGGIAFTGSAPDLGALETGVAASTPDLVSALELHLKFDEGTGTTAQDSTTHNHDGTLDTGASWGAAKMGASAVVLDGSTTSKVTVTGELTAPPAMTLALWVKLSGFPTAAAELISVGDQVLLRVNATQVTGYFYTGTDWVALPATVALGTTLWHHVAYTVQPGAQRVYVDGELVASGSSGSSIGYTGLGANTILGQHGNGDTNRRLQGMLDDVRVYTRALSALDLSALAVLADPPPLSVQITTPTSDVAHSTTATPLANLGGVAGDSTGVTGVTWSCPTCTPTTGTATCTPACGAATTFTNWVAAAPMALAVGSNLITVTATDASGSATDQLTVTYTPPPPGGGGAACTHYAGQPAGAACPTGITCGVNGAPGTSQGSPFLIANFWALAQPGRVLCLLNGTYTGGSSMITVPTSVVGTASQRITVRALNDGQVLIDGQDGIRPIFIDGRFVTVEGVNATRGDNATCTIRGQDNILRRVVCYEGGTNSDHGISVGGLRNLVEDAAWFGAARKGVVAGTGTAGPGFNTFRRVWAQWNTNTFTVSNPSITVELGYGQDNILAENMVATWNTDVGGRVTSPEGAFMVIATQNTRVLGSITYLKSTDSFPVNTLFGSYADGGSQYQEGIHHPNTNVLMQHLVSFVPNNKTNVEAFGLFNQTGSSPVNNVMRDSLGVSGPGNSSTIQSPAFSSVNNTLVASTGTSYTGPSIWTTIPGVCKRYVDGTLTTAPLWPWPMNQRIVDAMGAAGRTPVDVTATMQALFGTIPSTCLTTGVPPPETCTPPLVGIPPACTCPPGTIPPNCEPEPDPETCPPECPVQDVFVVAPAGSTPPGNDSNACTLEAPCLTINRARSLMTPGDILSLRAGTYTGAGNRITTSTGAFPAGNSWETPTRIAAYENETVVLQQTSATVITLDNPTTDRYLVFDRLICDGASTPTNNTVCFNMTNGVHHIRVQNNILRNTHFRGMLLQDVNNIEILNTTFQGATHSAEALSIQGASTNILVDNTLLHSNNAHGIQTAGTALSNLTLTRTVARNNGGTGFRIGATSALLANNLAHSNALGMQILPASGATKVLFTTLADNTGPELQIDAGATGTEVTNVIAVGGIVNNGTSTVLTTNLTTDPGFVGSGNYRPALATSPAVDTGTCLPGVVDVAVDGVARPQPSGGACDIGAYEQSSVSPPAPGALSATPIGASGFHLPQ